MYEGTAKVDDLVDGHNYDNGSFDNQAYPNQPFEFNMVMLETPIIHLVEDGDLISVITITLYNRPLTPIGWRSAR